MNRVKAATDNLCTRTRQLTLNYFLNAKGTTAFWELRHRLPPLPLFRSPLLRTGSRVLLGGPRRRPRPSLGDLDFRHLLLERLSGLERADPVGAATVDGGRVLQHLGLLLLTVSSIARFGGGFERQGRRVDAISEKENIKGGFDVDGFVELPQSSWLGSVLENVAKVGTTVLAADLCADEVGISHDAEQISAN